MAVIIMQAAVLVLLVMQMVQAVQDKQTLLLVLL
jgi:hypothetical protein